MLKLVFCVGVLRLVDSVRFSMCWVLVGLIMLLFYNCVLVQQGCFCCLNCLWIGDLKWFFLFVDYCLFLVLMLLCLIVVSMLVVCLLFIMLMCVFGYIYRKLGEQVCLYMLQLLVLNELLIIMVNLGILVQVMVIISLVLFLVMLLCLYLWLIMKLVMFCRNISGMLCWVQSLMKCVFFSVDLENRMLLLVMMFIGQLCRCVKLVISVVLQCGLNLLKCELLMMCMIILCILYGLWVLVGMMLYSLWVGC